MNATLCTAARRDASRSGSARTVLVALLFAVLAVAVYGLGVKALPSRARVADAIVRLPAALTTEQEARAAILAEPNVRRAVGACRTGESAKKACSAASVKSVRDRLSVRWSTDGPSGDSTASVRVAYRFRGDSPTAAALVERLAEQFAEPIRRRQSTAADTAYEAAVRAAAEAKIKLSNAQQRLDEFVQKRLEPAATPAADGVDRAEGEADSARLALRRQLDRARRYREQLLVDRTPQHPMVQAADLEIVDLERKLAATSDEMVPQPQDLSQELKEMIPAPTASPGLVGQAAEGVDSLDQPLGRFVPAQADPSATAPSRATAVAAKKRLAEFRALKRDVEVAREAYDLAVARQDEARRQQVQLPAVLVADARVMADSTATRPRPWRLSLVAIMVALAGTAGVMMVATGIGDSVTFADAAQARAALSAPLLATVPPADHLGAGFRWRRLAERLVTILCGLVLVAACTGVVLAMAGAFVPPFERLP